MNLDVFKGRKRAYRPPPVVPDREPLGVPAVTYGVIAVCVAVFLSLNMADDALYKSIFLTLVPSAFDIWSGDCVGLLTSAFVHVAIWHILFNMLWIKIFGEVLEPVMGRENYLFFIIGAAVVSSSVQFVFSGQTGIGFSGVGYAMFGFGLAARHGDARYYWVVHKKIVELFMIWLVLCFVLTHFRILNIGNGAHVGGLLFGYFTGNVFVAKSHRALCGAGLAALGLLVVLSVVYMPWSSNWKLHKIMEGEFDIAKIAESGDAETQFLYGFSLLLEEEDRAEGVKWMRKSAEQDYLPAMNGLAWTLATDVDEALRDGEQAAQWARRACEKDEWKTAAYIDTLAAAYAETEDWEKAVSTQEMAIEKMTDNDEQAGYRERLQSFINKEKIRE